MKVLLAAINAKYIHSNLAVYSLKAYAEKFGYKAKIAEYTINQPLNELLGELFEQKPDVICFSCYLWNISYVKALLKELPKILPEVRLWLGGPEVSFNAKQMLAEYPQLEGIMCGEGEETFRELMEHFEQGRPELIAVPTSVGYGANLNGLSALLTMINSCANGIAVVNIDNGYGAGYIATQINRLGVKR